MKKKIIDNIIEVLITTSIGFLACFIGILIEKYLL